MSSPSHQVTRLRGIAENRNLFTMTRAVAPRFVGNTNACNCPFRVNTIEPGNANATSKASGAREGPFQSIPVAMNDEAQWFNGCVCTRAKCWREERALEHTLAWKSLTRDAICVDVPL